VSGPRRGEAWGRPAGRAADVTVTGDDRALAASARARPGALVRFRPAPGSDLALAIGLDSKHESPGATELALDVLRVVVPGRQPDLAVNAVVLGEAPDQLGFATPTAGLDVRVDGRPWFGGRATTLLVATGEYLRGADVVPRGHPGDGRAEVQVYALRRAERRMMRARLRLGAHVPHPRLHQRAARAIEACVTGRSWRLELDGAPAGRVAAVRLEVVPGGLRLLV
jgi:hypothetical protein